MPCTPSRDCGQRDRCARPLSTGADAIDASCSITARQGWCPMFIDRRGVALIGQEISMSNYPRGKYGPPPGLSATIYDLIHAAGAKGAGMADLVQATGKPMQQIIGIIGNLRGRDGRRVLIYSLPVFCKTARYFEVDVPRAEAEQTVAALRAPLVEQSVAAERARREASRKRVAERDKEKRKAQRLAHEAARKARREAVAAERQARIDREKVEAARRQALSAAKRAEIAANNRLAKKIKGDGTHRKPAERKPEPAAPTVATWDDSLVYREPRRPGRYEVLTAPPTFTGKPLLPPSSCAARALS